jgi:hypothetical protein
VQYILAYWGGDDVQGYANVQGVVHPMPYIGTSKAVRLELNVRYAHLTEQQPTPIEEKDNTDMAAAITTNFPYHSDDLWLLASATVYDTKEVALVLPVARPALLDELMSGFGTFLSVWELRGKFKSLVHRQGKLLNRFQVATPERWSLADCAHMSQLLDELLQDEKMVLTSALDSPKRALVWWDGYLKTLQSQTEELERICIRMDALSVPESTMPGDEDYRDFMSLLSSPYEYDFSTDDDRRKAHSLT